MDSDQTPSSLTQASEACDTCLIGIFDELQSKLYIHAAPLLEKYEKEVAAAASIPLKEHEYHKQRIARFQQIKKVWAQEISLHVHSARDSTYCDTDESSPSSNSLDEAFTPPYIRSPTPHEDQASHSSTAKPSSSSLNIPPPSLRRTTSSQSYSSSSYHH